MRYFLIVLLLMCATIAYSQQPAFYKFDNTQFTGTNIYDVIQDNDQNYWFATDKGLIKHDGYSYEQKTCDEMNGSSVFGFVKNSKGVVYCHNLHYQIFKIESGVFELYYEIPEELASHEIFMKIDNQDNLLIQVLGLIQISTKKHSVKILKKELFKPDGRPVNFHILPDGSTVTTSTRSNIIHQKNGTFTFIGKKNIESNEISRTLEAFKWITLNNRVFAITRNEMDIFELDLNTFELIFVRTLDVNLSRQRLRIYHTEEELWITGISNGCYVFDKEFKPKYNGQLLYPNKFISDVFVDSEANILVSTFDEGIMVIPNNDVTGFELPNDEKISTISSDGDSTLFIGSNIGNFYSFIDVKLNLVFTDPIEKRE